MSVILTDGDYKILKQSLKTTIGLDLSQYKQQQMQRRIRQWLDRTGVKTYKEYLKILESSEEERLKFTEYLTINTSQFYRDVSVFKEIEEKMLPDLLQRFRRLKIWSAGASIGAEIYTVAMILQELSPNTAHTLLGTDFDQSALVKAGAGVYGENLLNSLPSLYKNKYFTQENGSFKIDAGIKGKVRLKRHNLLEDSYEKGFHMILCRNVFIYFTPETQARLTKQFSESLVPGGIFVVGSAENLMAPETADLKRGSYCIYQKD